MSAEGYLASNDRMVSTLRLYSHETRTMYKPDRCVSGIQIAHSVRVGTPLGAGVLETSLADSIHPHSSIIAHQYLNIGPFTLHPLSLRLNANLPSEQRTAAAHCSFS